MSFFIYFFRSTEMLILKLKRQYFFMYKDTIYTVKVIVVIYMYYDYWFAIYLNEMHIIL